MRIAASLRALACLLVASAAQAQYVPAPWFGPSPSEWLLHPADPTRFGQLDIGGRFSDIDGDAARYQRYRDLRDGAVLDLAGLRMEKHGLIVLAAARSVGWRDQRYQLGVERPGWFRLRALYDQTPMFISRDTRTPYDPLPAADGAAARQLTMPDSLQAQIQANPAANFRPLIEAAAGSRFFDSRLQRTTAGFDLRCSAGPVDATVNYVYTAKSGNLPFGAYLQIPIEVPLPIDSRAHDIRTSVEWSNEKGMLRAGWDGSWYDNDAEDFVWDNPQRAVGSTSASSQGRLAEWPSNDLLSFSVAGAYKLPGRTTANAVFALGRWNQDVTLLPFTINSAVSFLPSLSRPTAAAKANTSSAVLNLSSYPWQYFGLSARYRFHEFDNRTPPFVVARTDGRPDRVTADGSAGTWSDPAIGKTGSEPFGYARNQFDLDATLTRVPKTTVRLGYGRYWADTHYRVYESVAEDTFRVGVDVIGTDYATFRSVYERSQRRSHDLEPLALERAEEQPGQRHFDIASRDRDRLWLLATLMPASTLDVNASVSWTSDTYLNPETPAADRFGLQDYSNKSYSLGLEWWPRDGLAAGVSGSYEDFGGTQQSRSASPGPQVLDPNRNWALDESNRAWSAIVNLDLLSGIQNTELRLAYNYTDYRGTYRHELPGGSVLTAPVLLPDLTSSESRVSVDLRYLLSKRVALGLVYWYDSYDVEDFTLGPDVVSGVAQPAVEEGQTGTVNALLLNYFYRPFKAHSAWLRLSYRF